MIASPRHPIAVYTYSLVGGGAEKYAVQLANGLARKGHDVDLIIQVDRALSPYLGMIDPSVKQIAMDTHSPFKAVRFLRDYFRAERPRALFGVQQKPSLLAIVAGLWAGYKNIVPTMHVHMDTYVTNEYQARRKFLGLLVAALYRFAPQVVAVSEGAGTALKKWIGSGPLIKIIINGFDLDEMRKQAREPVDFPWFTNKEEPVIIACGRLVDLKGFDVLLRAFARLREKRNARLVILGEGERLSYLQDLAKSLGVERHVAFPGFVANPLAWFAQSDMFVLSSRTEGFGIVLVEAMACGTAVISTNCPSGPTEILQNGAYGQLVSVDDVEALANAMQTQIEKNERHEKGADVRAYVDAHYGLEKMTSAYLDVVESLSA